MAHLRNRLSTHHHYAIIKTQIANLGKLTALSEEAVSLIVIVIVIAHLYSALGKC